MRLFIAEKPDQARTISNVLGVRNKERNYITLSSGDVFTWAVGHLVEQIPPDAYSSAWGSPWKWEQLPMVPSTWKVAPYPDKKHQLNTIKSLLKKAAEVVICTDAGREGELIARELLDYFDYRGKVKRLWLQTLVDEDIKRALSSLLPGEKTEPLYQAALARQRADWVYGMNLSRAATLTFGSLVSVGKAQIPTLGLVVKKDLETENFTVCTYYVFAVSVKTETGHKLELRYGLAEEFHVYDERDPECLKKESLLS